METWISQPGLPPATPARTLLCPACGYDLRGSTADRCSECGLPIDRAALDRSAFPWAHRAGLGRFRAFFKTVWLVTADARSLRHEAAKAQSPRDGATFRRWVAVLLGVCFAVIAAMVIGNDGIPELVVQPHEFSVPRGAPRWAQDLLVPWSAGIAIPPALFVYSTLLAFYVAGAPRSVFRTPGLPEDYRQTVEAIGGYVAAPLVLLLPASAGYAALFLLWRNREAVERGPLLPILSISSFVLALAALGGTVYRTGQWRARTAHAGYTTGLAGMAELLVRWAIGCAVALGVIPWCVGFVWIVVDSFRR